MGVCEEDARETRTGVPAGPDALASAISGLGCRSRVVGFRARGRDASAPLPPAGLPPVGCAEYAVTRDPDLVRRCLDGDRVAWAELLARYADLVHGLLHRTGLDAAGCADGFQEVSLLLWKNLRRLRDAERVLPWLATTAKRVGWRMSERRRARAEREAAVAHPDRDPAGAPDVAFAALEEEQAVREALAALAERCRRLLDALYFAPGDPSYDEIAARLGVPRGSIGPTRRRCLEALRREVEARGFGRADVSGTPPRGSVPARPVSGRRRKGQP
jgi:RNA polymerase sigma factor (sigma-70 family)